jgi:hypothetical protein
VKLVGATITYAVVSGFMLLVAGGTFRYAGGFADPAQTLVMVVMVSLSMITAYLGYLTIRDIRNESAE